MIFYRLHAILKLLGQSITKPHDILFSKKPKGNQYLLPTHLACPKSESSKVTWDPFRFRFCNQSKSPVLLWSMPSTRQTQMFGVLLMDFWNPWIYWVQAKEGPLFLSSPDFVHVLHRVPMPSCTTQFLYNGNQLSVPDFNCKKNRGLPSQARPVSASAHVPVGKKARACSPYLCNDNNLSSRCDHELPKCSICS